MYIYFQWTPGVEEYVRTTEGAAANKVGKEIEYVYYYTLVKLSIGWSIGRPWGLKLRGKMKT